ncbi:MAG: hybrid sensor histidine kinase/response regulator [Ardenticatenaceae bacterium]|nr:hybrid sensor histidine kinase/response regulator [Ardenticatenaceae bacterium]
MIETARVCIVDDNVIARETLADLLYPENYELLLIESGLNLLAQIDSLNPDVILLDVMMPELNGFDVCQRLKTHPKWQHVPIILVTALDSKDSLVRGLDAGADEFVSKPVNGSELRARVRSMLRVKQQYDALNAMLQLREDMANMLIHDMRAPLATIALHAGLMLQRQNLATNDLQALQTIQAELRHLESFINDMLLVAKIEHDKLLLKREPCDLVQLIQQLVAQHELLARLHQIKLNVDMPARPLVLPIDETLFSRMLDNLLANALRFSPTGGTVTVRLGEVNEPATGLVRRIQVVDEGAGIPEEERRNVFDKFKIVSLKREGLSQIGLGLALCRMVAEAHGGQIYVTANEPHGAVFTVEF